MIITYDWIHLHSTSEKVGSWTNAQLKAIGVKSKKKGWIWKVVGKEITDEQREIFESYGYRSVGKRMARLILS